MPNHNFSNKVLQVVSQIPSGKTLTYQEVAKRAGSPRAYRAVGNILKNNYNKGSRNIPCHRVIRSDGKIGEYAGGNSKKKQMLKKENGS